MGEIFSDGDGTLSLCRLDASWARRAADFDARIFPVGVSPSRHCEDQTSSRHCSALRAFHNCLTSVWNASIPTLSSLLCEGATRPKQSVVQYCQRCEASNQVSIDRHVGAERLLATTDCICCYCDVESAWPFEVWQAMLSNPELNFFAYVRPAEGMQTHGDIVALGGISNGDEPEILTLGVEQSHRGQGLGAKLLDFLIAQAQKNTNATHITLEVRADNEEALALYTSRGFTPYTNRHRHQEKGIRKAQLSLIKKL